MAEDRMLSDEILLGLIKANSGGGGVGTSNYNDLSNKPQIGGVTLSGNKSASDLGLVAAEAGKGLSTNDYTNEDKNIVGGVTVALADKADKADVKNEFIGTTAQWNALTTEQRKAYDTYQITDDYTEGRNIYLPTIYSEEERQVGVWTDGKPVYQKTVIYDTPFNIDNGSWYTSTETYSNINLINAVIVNSSFAIYTGSIIVIENNHLVIGNQTHNQPMSNIKYITLQYTKTE